MTHHADSCIWVPKPRDLGTYIVSWNRASFRVCLLRKVQGFSSEHMCFVPLQNPTSVGPGELVDRH